MIFGEFITYYILPFILIFVVVFAILQKSKIFGDKKQQIDALVALTIALILVAVPGPQKDIIVQMMPWLGVALAVLLVFFILYGFVAGDLTELPTGIKVTLGILSLVFTIAVVVYLTNVDQLLSGLLAGETMGFVVNGIVIALVVAGIIWVVVKSGK